MWIRSILYSARQRAAFTKQASEELRVKEETLRRDLGRVLLQQIASGSSEAAGVHGANQVVAIGNVELGIGGDLIVAIDGQPVTREDTLVRVVAQKRVGDVIKLTVVRNRRTLVIPVKLLRPPADLG